MHQQGSLADTSLRIGPHRYRVEGDLFFWQPCGEVLSEHARGVLAVVLEIYQRHGYVLYLLDGRQGKPLKPETRRVVTDTLRPLQGSLALAAFGLSPLSRAAAILLFNAARLLTGLNLPFRFSSTESDARAFLNEYRSERNQAPLK